MLTPSLPSRNPQAPYGTAKRLRRTGGPGPGHLIEMATVVCTQCGAQFTIGHPLFFVDNGLAQRQAAWLEERFVWDHIQESKHSGSIRLPGEREMKPVPAMASPLP